MPDISELQIYASYRQDIEGIARQIEYECADHLLPAPAGIYVINKVEPVMIPSETYYIKEKIGTSIVKTPVIDITNITECIYKELLSAKSKTSEGIDKVVIPKTFMLNKAKYVSAEPILPYRGIQIVKELINQQINEYVRYKTSHKTLEEIVANSLTTIEDRQFESITVKISNIYNQIKENVYSFMTPHDWSLYFVNLQDTKLTIEKSIDYRAFEWIKHLNDIKIKQNENS